MSEAERDEDRQDALHTQRECVEFLLEEVMSEQEILGWWHVPLAEFDGFTPWAALEAGFYEMVVRQVFGYLKDLA